MLQCCFLPWSSRKMFWGQQNFTQLFVSMGTSRWWLCFHFWMNISFNVACLIFIWQGWQIKFKSWQISRERKGQHIDFRPKQSNIIGDWKSSESLQPISPPFCQVESLFIKQTQDIIPETADLLFESYRGPMNGRSLHMACDFHYDKWTGRRSRGRGAVAEVKYIAFKSFKSVTNTIFTPQSRLGGTLKYSEVCFSLTLLSPSLSHTHTHTPLLLICLDLQHLTAT